MAELEGLREDDPADLSFFDESVPKLNADEAILYINKRANEGRKVEDKVSVIKRACDAGTPFKLRRPTGFISIDMSIAGGFPAGGVSQVGGPDSIGKDAVAATTLSTLQTIYGEKSRLAVCTFEAGFDKQHYRNQGVVVPDSEDDILMEDARRQQEDRPALTDDQIARRMSSLGDFFVIDSGTAEDRLQAVLDLIAQNFCQMIVLDSIAAIATKYRMDAPLSQDARQADRASVLTEWMRMAQYHFSNPLRGRMNLTSVLITNQVRANRNKGTGKRAQFAPEYVDSAPKSIKHGKLVSLALRPGESIPKTGKKRGKIVKWKVDKAKAGSHEGPSGELSYYFNSGFDRFSDLFNVAKTQDLILHKDGAPKCDIIDTNGEVIGNNIPWGTKGSKTIEALYVDQDLYWNLYYACLHSLEVSCLHRL
jgi:RecA/RadA recombinase